MGVVSAVREGVPDLPARLMEVVEGLLDRGERSPVPRSEAQRGDEAEVGKENGEAREAMGPMGAPLLLRLDHLLALRVLGLAVVRPVVVVDDDVHGRHRKERSDLASEGEGDGALGLPESEVLEDPSSGPVGATPTALGAGSVDGGTRGGGPKEEVGGVAEGGGAEGSDEGVLQEGKEPGQRGRADLSIREGPPSPAGISVGCEFFSLRSPGRRRGV